jgi:hypothetical protein
MGKSASKYLPKYVKDFNIENRMHKHVEKEIKQSSKQVQPAPRHPSTQKILEQLESKYLLLLFVRIFESECF